MTRVSEVLCALDEVSRFAQVERCRAEREAEVAERHERQLRAGAESLREFHRRMAAVHRKAEQKHRTAMRMHDTHAARLTAWLGTTERHQALPPFMASVAETADALGAAITVFGLRPAENLSAASDDLARAAQDLEFTFGEGPARDIMVRPGTVNATGASLKTRWPGYGPAVAALGIRSLIAVPITASQTRFGALTLFDPADRAWRADPSRLRTLADALAGIALDLPSALPGPGRTAFQLVLGEMEQHTVTHQAAGMVAVQQGCSVRDALDLIRARAFAENRTADSVAAQVVSHGLRLGPG